VFIVQAYQTSLYVVPRGSIFLGKWRRSFAGSSDGKTNIQSACALNTPYIPLQQRHDIGPDAIVLPKFMEGSFNFRSLIFKSFLCRLGSDGKAPCPPAPSSCPPSKYRRGDGACNNVRHPEWGTGGSPFRRLLPPVYSDGKDQTCNRISLSYWVTYSVL
jgi:hypothetical protein